MKLHWHDTWKILVIMIIGTLFTFFALAQNAGTSDNWVAFVSGGNSGKLFAIGIPSLKLLKELPLGIDIHGLALAKLSGGPVLYASDKAADRIYAVDLKTLSVTKTIGIQGPFGPSALCVSPDGKTLVACGELTGKVAKIDATSGDVKVLAAGEPPSAPESCVITPDGAHCLVANYCRESVMVFSMEPFQLAKELPVGFNPQGLAASADGKVAVVGNKLSATSSFIDLASLTVTGQADSGATPFGSVVDSKGAYAYQAEMVGGVVAKLDIANKKMVDQFPAHLRPAFLGITPDDKILVVINKYSTNLLDPKYSVSVLDNTGTVSPNNVELIDVEPQTANYGKPIGQSAIKGDPQAVAIVAKADLPGSPLETGAELVAGDGLDKLSLPLPPGTKYIPRDDRAAGVFEKPDGGVEVIMKAFSYMFVPSEVRVKKGSRVTFYLTNIDRDAAIIKNPDVSHGFTIDGYADKANVVLPKGVTAVVELVADKAGTFDFYCSRVCGPMHKEMRGKFIVEE